MRCTKCGTDKPEEEFYRSTSYYCRECEINRVKNYYQRHRETRIKYQKKYYETNRDAYLKYSKRYYREVIKPKLQKFKELYG